MSRRPGDGEAKASPSAREAALRMLARRERSRTELRLALRRKGYDAGEIEAAILDLAQEGLQSDSRFAEAFSREAGDRRGYAGGAIRARLRQRGVGAEEAAAATAETPEAEEARARRVAERRVRALASLPPEVRVRRLAAYLSRRGYREDLCGRLAEELTRDEA